MYLAILSVFIGSFNFTFNHTIPICNFLQIDTIHSYHYTSTLTTWCIGYSDICHARQQIMLINNAFAVISNCILF